MFLEVLKEIPGHLSLLLHTEKLKSQGWHPTSSSDIYRPFDLRTKRLTQQISTIMLMNGEGFIKPYIELTYQEWRDMEHDPGYFFQYIDKTLLKAMTGKYYKAVARYCKENQISLKTPTGLRRALDQYEKILRMSQDMPVK